MLNIFSGSWILNGFYDYLQWVKRNITICEYFLNYLNRTDLPCAIDIYELSFFEVGLYTQGDGASEVSVKTLRCELPKADCLLERVEVLVA